MSAGHPHSRPNEKHPDELDKIEKIPDFQQMRARPFRVTVTRQIPDSAGYSVLGDEYFIDTDLYRAVLAGSWTDPRTGQVHSTRVPGLNPMQIIQCLLLHEQTEKCILDADNLVNLYQDAHEFATLAEHTKVKTFGGRPVDYERALAPLIAWNQIKPLTKVPANLSCAPLLDEPDTQDKVTIAELVKLGVVDAGKISKKTVDYSPSKGADRCGGCANWGSPNRSAELAPCLVVDGAVRTNFWCTKYKYKEATNGQAQQGPPSGVQGGSGQDRPGIGNSQPGGGAGSGQPQGLPGSPQGQPAPQPGEGVT